MNQIFERIGDAVCDAFNFFESVKARRGDDPLVREYKSLQLTVVLGIIAMAVLGLLMVVLPDGTGADPNVLGALVGQLQGWIQAGVRLLLTAAAGATGVASPRSRSATDQRKLASSEKF